MGGFRSIDHTDRVPNVRRRATPTSKVRSHTQHRAYVGSEGARGRIQIWLQNACGYIRMLCVCITNSKEAGLCRIT